MKTMWINAMKKILRAAFWLFHRMRNQARARRYDGGLESGELREVVEDYFEKASPPTHPGQFPRRQPLQPVFP